ncbi:MAG TPA: chemotaxis response regulator protein-glutamate methylesterase [Leptospiraceae bacterium]|nr:chemotaxis response regulator protein-glutamate methylesterase [Leptospirales bacterium]HMW59920.1 chemotaxis response regulator protein-glutamate methylesterase [Leptospiraceae bacterium]HMX56387.1 chemotaxis response regulator protein-glutamate methylesterase [Leptospiraceae bacterium]HNE25428.1 chemotaxis response regulator protein-glutamate methylesterase [Leptospiraceae bacterium]HNJ34915.1 chemotaxis response regulator protein-glutamate methylesterase [Leptospiraceae bacterium]
MKKIGVMIVDDSAVVRTVLTTVLTSVSDIEVIATAGDPIFAMEKMKKRWPDVIVLDIEMPRMNGIDFLKTLMRDHPTPCVICSSLTAEGTSVAMQAMAAGAVSIISKPKMGTKEFLEESRDRIVDAVRGASQSQLKPIDAQDLPPRAPEPAADKPAVHTSYKRMVVLGASTGGTMAIEQVLSGLPADCPAVLIVQHMPEKFTHAFADRLDKSMRMSVREAQNGDPIMPGRVLIAPGNQHMEIKRTATGLEAVVRSGDYVNRHRPSVDVLFESAAKLGGTSFIGVILTGMGGDGSQGLLSLKDKGARTIAQDQATSVVFGMPQEAIKLGAAELVLPIDKIAAEILKLAR